MEQFAMLIGFDPELLLWVPPIIMALSNAFKKWMSLKGWLCFIPTIVLAFLVAFKIGGDWYGVTVGTILFAGLSSGVWESGKILAHKMNGGS